MANEMNDDDEELATFQWIWDNLHGKDGISFGFTQGEDNFYYNTTKSTLYIQYSDGVRASKLSLDVSCHSDHIALLKTKKQIRQLMEFIKTEDTIKWPTK